MLRVVLADDENKVILLMQKLIDWEALGYEIAGTANDGLRALELVREKQPHLLITDVRMPGCDGIELIQRAKALQPKLHFIVISGYRKFEYAQNALKYGVEETICSSPSSRRSSPAFCCASRRRWGRKPRWNSS